MPGGSAGRPAARLVPQLLARLADGRLAWAAAVAITDAASRLSVAELELLDTAICTLVDHHDPDPDTLGRAPEPARDTPHPQPRGRPPDTPPPDTPF